MHSEVQHVRFVTWVFVFLGLVLGAGAYLKFQGKNEGKAAETVNMTVPGPVSSILVGHWTLDGNDVVWGDTASEIKDISGYAKHGNSSNLAAGSAVVGRIGQGLVFNGSSDSISLGNIYNGVKTVAFWVKPNTTTEPFIDLNGTATIDVTSGVVAANNFTTPTIYVDGADFTALAAPTFVAEYPTAFNSATSPKTAMNAVAINSGDVLVLVSADEGNNTLGETENGSASWANLQNSAVADYTAVRSSGYTATTNETLTATVTATAGYFGGNIVRFSGSDGIGASATNSGTTGSPSVSITTTQDNSAIVVIVGDWNAISGTQTFTSDGGAGSPANLTDYPGDGAQYGVAIAYYPDAGTAGAKTVGMSAPAGQKWTIHAIEVKGEGDTPLDTAWHHIVITTATGINASAVYLGKIASSYFDGILDDVRFYSTEFTATQVADLYRASGAKQTINFGMQGTLTNGLVGHWTFDGNDVVWGDTGTEVKDVSGNANHGAASGLTATSAVIGKLGQGLSFNGTGDYVNAGSASSLDDVNQKSICMWILPTNVAISRLASKWEVGNNYFWDFFLDTGAIGFSHEFTGGTALWRTAENLVVTNSWQHICVTYDRTSAANDPVFYYNGLPQPLKYATNSSGSARSEAGGDLIFGYHVFYDNYHTGKMDDIRFYNRILSASEIVNLYNLGK